MRDVAKSKGQFFLLPFFSFFSLNPSISKTVRGILEKTFFELKSKGYRDSIKRKRQDKDRV